MRVNIDSSNNISFSAQEEITANASLGTATIVNDTSKQFIAPLLIGNRLQNTIETDATNHQFVLSVGGVSHTIDLPTGKVYSLGSLNGRNELLKDVRAQLTSLGIDQQVQITFTEDNRLQFKGQYKDGVSPSFNDIRIEDTATGNIVSTLGFDNWQGSEKAVVKSETLNIGGMLGDIDKNMENILAKLAEIGAKNNRLELSQNRLEDNLLNIKALLSKVQDADMTEVIMKLKMEEMVYQASLSTGARIIQPTLVDFIR